MFPQTDGTQDIHSVLSSHGGDKIEAIENVEKIIEFLKQGRKHNKRANHPMEIMILSSDRLSYSFMLTPDLNSRLNLS